MYNIGKVSYYKFPFKSFVMDINGLITEINSRIKGSSQITKNLANGLFNQLKTIVNPMGLTVSYNFNDLDGTLRFIFNVNERYVNYSIPLTVVARGLIVGILKNTVADPNSQDLIAKVLCFPPRETEDTDDLITLAQEQEHYNIFPLLDGISISFYYDPDYGWLWGTHHAFDIKNKYWRGYKYSDLFNDIVKDFSFDKLDKSRTYHIRMKHPSIHPYMANNAFVYHLSTSSSDNLSEESIGLKRQKPVQLDSKQQGLGYILRAKDQDRMDLKFETKRRKDIVKMLYKMPNIKDPVKRKEFGNYFNMKDFYILYNFLKPAYQHKQFFGIFKQFQDKHDLYEKIINAVVSNIDEQFPEPSTFIKNESIGEDIDIQKIASKISKVLEPKIKVFYKKGSSKTIKDLVMDQHNSFLIYNAIYSGEDLSKSALVKHIPAYSS